MNPASPGLFRQAQLPGLTRLSGIELQKLLIAILIVSGGRGGGRELPRPPWRKKFLFLSTSSPRPPGFLLVSHLRALLSTGAWRAGGPLSIYATALRAAHGLKAPQQGLQGKLPGSWGSDAGWVPTLPARRDPSSGPRIPHPKERGTLFPSHLSPVHLSCAVGKWAETGVGEMPPSPHLREGGGRAESARSEGRLRSPSPQRSESALAATAAAAAAWAAWGGDCASPRMRSAWDLNATETVIHHCGSQQTFAGGSAIGCHSHVPAVAPSALPPPPPAHCTFISFFFSGPMEEVRKLARSPRASQDPVTQ